MLALSEICKTLGGRLVLDHISLELVEEGINCLLGPSGCGKSTLLRVVAGLLPPDAGVVHIKAAGCSMVFQEPRLLPWLTVKENLALAITKEMPRKKQAQAIGQVLAQMQLGDIEALMPRELSGGMAQRVGIARALLRKPRILLMDEPFAALDAMTRGRLQNMLIDLIASESVTCLFVTHDIREAALIGNRIFIMREGRIAAQIAKPADEADFEQIIIQQL